MSDTHHPLSPEQLLAQEEVIRKLALRLVRDPQRAEDLSQDTLVRALQARTGPTRNIAAWIRKITRNVIITQNVAEKRRRRRDRLVARTEAIPDEEKDEEKLQIQTVIAQEIQALQDSYREVIHLHFFEDLTPQEIASRLGISQDNVYKRLQRGIAQLRKQLDKRYQGREFWIAAILTWNHPPASSTPPLAPLVIKKAITNSTSHWGLAAAGAVAAATVTFLALPVNSATSSSPKVAQIGGDSLIEKDSLKAELPDLPSTQPELAKNAFIQPAAPEEQGSYGTPEIYPSHIDSPPTPVKPLVGKGPEAPTAGMKTPEPKKVGPSPVEMNIAWGINGGKFGGKLPMQSVDENWNPIFTASIGLWTLNTARDVMLGNTNPLSLIQGKDFTGLEFPASAPLTVDLPVKTAWVLTSLDSQSIVIGALVGTPAGEKHYLIQAPAEEIHPTVVDSKGKPIADAKISWNLKYANLQDKAPGTILMLWDFFQLYIAKTATTNAHGVGALKVPAGIPGITLSVQAGKEYREIPFAEAEESGFHIKLNQAAEGLEKDEQKSNNPPKMKNPGQKPPKKSPSGKTGQGGFPKGKLPTSKKSPR